LKCNQKYPVYLIHEIKRIGDANKSLVAPSWIRKDIHGLLKQTSILRDEHTGAQYVVLEHPGKTWRSLAQFSRPMQDVKWILSNSIVLGEVLLEIYREKYLPVEWSRFSQDILEAVIVIEGQQLSFTELSLFSQDGLDIPVSGKPDQVYVDTMAQIIYTLSSGKKTNMRASVELAEVPPELKRLIEQARRADNPSFPDFLDGLKAILVTPEFVRTSLRQMAGWLTDVGRQRDHNEDTVGKFSLSLAQRGDAPEVGLYLVADGMGGHQAGEKASSDVILEILNKFISERLKNLEFAPRLSKATVKLDETMTPGNILKEAIQEVNKYLLQTRQKITSDRGTTITAALVIGKSCAVANVGDSRTYLFRQGSLKQVTQDHSLVANLVKAKMITPEEARNHPDRNQIFRTLGDKPNVEVDVFDLELMSGDHLLLCSDGLWEMVYDNEIGEILRTAASPQSACDKLVHVANRNGGEDNISAIVVWIE